MVLVLVKYLRALRYAECLVIYIMKVILNVKLLFIVVSRLEI